VPAVALSRVGARVVESGPGGQELAADAWQRLEALPDPRSPQGRVYPLACLVAIAVCAFSAAGNDRFTAVGQWIRRAGQADLARLRAPWDPLAGRYRAPDEKTIRVVLDRVDPRALARAAGGRDGGRLMTGRCPAQAGRWTSVKLGRRADAGRRATGPARAGHWTAGRCERGAGPGPVKLARHRAGGGRWALLARSSWPA
jgi:DDE family transposase